MAHTEVKVQIPRTKKKSSTYKTKDSISVRLIEVNTRQHNTDFAPLCQACLGYNKIDLCATAYLDIDKGDLSEDVLDFAEEQEELANSER